MSRDDRPLPYAIGDNDDTEVLALIDSWRYRGQPLDWDAIVGHERQVRRCQEIVEALRRPEEELERLHVRLGRGLVIVGPPGSGKTMIARATAGALGLDVIAPPVSELTPGLVARLYAQLGRLDPVVVVLDEAEPLVGPYHLADADLVRALCVALDGLDRPSRAPITIALVTATDLSPIATRPGRLSPRLELGLPTAEERRILLVRAIAGLPTVGQIDIDRVVERTMGWSGAQLTVAVAEAMSRSLPSKTDALTNAHLLAIVTEDWVLTDPQPSRRQYSVERAAKHEAAHCILADLRWPGRVASVTLGGNESAGRTRLDEEQFDRLLDRAAFRDLAAMALAGLAGELICYGVDHISDGSSRDRAQATTWLTKWREATLPYDPDVLEQGSMSDHGSERMRAAIHAEIEQESAKLLAEVVAVLAPHRSAIDELGWSIREADDMTISGDALSAAIQGALEAERPECGG
jgi:SpoVK/Ycf46/Vps4 family AAA+-type ATPase